jgi:hypothetical protein
VRTCSDELLDDLPPEAKAAFDLVGEYAGEIEQCDLQIEAQKRRKTIAADRLQRQIAPLIDKLHQDDRANILAYFYWNFLEKPFGPVSEAFGFTSVAQVKTLPGMEIGALCVDCGTVLVAKSRAAFIIMRHNAGVVSPTCRCDRCSLARLGDLKSTRYADYLQTPHWQKTRESALERADFRCQLCSAGQVILDVHHNTYEHLGEELPRDLIVLCRECHGKLHDKLPEAPA